MKEPHEAGLTFDQRADGCALVLSDGLAGVVATRPAAEHDSDGKMREAVDGDAAQPGNGA